MEAVDQLASAGTFRVVKEPLAFLRVLEWKEEMQQRAEQCPNLYFPNFTPHLLFRGYRLRNGRQRRLVNDMAAKLPLEIQYLHGLMKQMQKIQISGTVLYEDVDNNIPEPSSAASGNAFGGQYGDSLKGYGEMRATQSDAVSSGASGKAPKNRKF